MDQRADTELGAGYFAQLAAAAGAEEVPDEPEELESAEPDELELSDFAGSLADDAPLRLSVR